MGDQVADLQRFVFVPEEWERNERNAQIVSFVVQGAGLLLGAVMVIGGAITAIVSWSRRQFAVRAFLAMFATFLFLAVLRLANGFPAVMAGLSTAQPLRLQLAVLLASGAVGLTLQAAAIALIAGAVPRWFPDGQREPRRAAAFGLAFGAMAAATTATAMLWSGRPLWPSYAGASSFVPWLASATNPVVSVLTRTTLLLFVVAVANGMTGGWTRRRLITGALLIVVGGLLSDAVPMRNPVLWVAFAASMGLLLLVAYALVLRYDVRAAPVGVAVMTTAATAWEGWTRAYSGGLAGAIVAIALTWLVAYVWVRALTRSPRSTRELTFAVARGDTRT
jgi:hypothetical protein